MTLSTETPDLAMPDLESALFCWDADSTTHRADAFVRAAFRPLAVVRSIAPAVPPFDGTYSHKGGETVVVRSNDVALALAVHHRAA